MIWLLAYLLVTSAILVIVSGIGLNDAITTASRSAAWLCVSIIVWGAIGLWLVFANWGAL